jgi:hypothetical protein
MSKVAPIYSARPNAPQVYHDNNKCTERNNIERENVRQGTGNRPLCKHCADLNRAGQ